MPHTNSLLFSLAELPEDYLISSLLRLLFRQPLLKRSSFRISCHTFFKFLIASLYTHSVRTVQLRETWGLARDEFTVNMASILSLPEECLCKIVSFISHPRTFYSVALTCKRFLQVTRNTRCVLHTRLLKFKALYFIRRYDVEIDLDEEKRDKMRKLVCGCAQLTKAREFLTYDKVIDLWQKNGPVAAKLLTWFRNQQLDSDGEIFDNSEGISWYDGQTLTLGLPSGRQTLVIKTAVCVTQYHTGEESSKITLIHITSEDLQLDVKFKEPIEWWSRELYGRPNYLNSVRFSDGYLHLSENEAKFAPLRPVIHILQKELGETVPPITNYFFIWLCYLFPDKLNLHEEDKLTFKDAARNRKPTYASIQPSLDEYHKVQQFETTFRKLFSEWEDDQSNESYNARMIAETIRLLAQRSQVDSLKSLSLV